ncbi:hypothetical protein CONPUDRAFT_168509 [Coniophora puteana RWD-64-598 SS2]|uniref:Uncharacterized protein n=1 Tax=Coniophora puteana (strain RWD-64-598) TaxID=741705 RepID=A0A5M3MBT3_CONPW|nr:uncharacterized protein CONPUDRAFT_168509 [Coniophora puteana RWD-64-598 SS2]EIW76699.1 hypothetical protein CONPUDRAFT_168509 [Coniophora puteana RWD-64-598 SS2]
MSSFVAVFCTSFVQALCNIVYILRLPFIKTAALFTSWFRPPAEDPSLPLPATAPHEEQTKKGSRFHIWPFTVKGKSERPSTSFSSLSHSAHTPRRPRLFGLGSKCEGKFDIIHSDVEKGLSADLLPSPIEDYSPVHNGTSPVDHPRLRDPGDQHRVKYTRSAPCLRVRSDFGSESFPPSPTLFLGRSPTATASPSSSTPTSPSIPASPSTPVVRRYARTAHLFPLDELTPIKPKVSSRRSDADHLDDVDRLIIEMQRELAHNAKNTRKFSDQVRVSLMVVDDEVVI